MDDEISTQIEALTFLDLRSGALALFRRFGKLVLLFYK